MRRCCRRVSSLATFLLAIAATAWPQSASEEEAEAIGQGLFVDFSLGWAAVVGNDVYVGDRTTVSGSQTFDDSDLERLVTRMDSFALPRVRAGYRGDRWGVEGELWRASTSGELDGSFEPRRFGRSSEVMRFWNWWRPQSADEVRYRARNELSLLSARVDVTRNLARAVTLSIGAHLAKLANERGEAIDFTFSPRGVETIETESGSAELEGWFIGPSVGLKGSVRWGESARVGYSFAQSILFSSVNHQADWSRSAANGLPFFDVGVSLSTDFNARAAVPVSDLRTSLSYDLGEHFSVGVLGMLSVWYEAPTALEFGAILERWTLVERTLVFASIGPVVKIRF